jgi:hypothetical protein
MEDDSVFDEEEGEERDSFVQPARGLRSFALVSCLLVAVFELGIFLTLSCSVVDPGWLSQVPDPNFFHNGVLNTDPNFFHPGSAS